jgi:hypothetical protein
MYDFKSINVEYDISVKNYFPNGKEVAYHRMEHVTARSENDSGLFIFRISPSSNETLNNKSLENFDEIFLRLGKSLFPVILSVTNVGEIVSIENLDEIRQRRNLEIAAIKNEYPNAYYIDRYIECCEELSERQFLKSLLRNNFIQFYFTNYGMLTLRKTIYNFPKKGNIIPLELQHGNSSQEYNSMLYNFKIPGCYLYDIEQGNSTMKYKFSESGDLLSFEGCFEVEVLDEGFYRREIVIRANTESRQIKSNKKWFECI